MQTFADRVKLAQQITRKAFSRLTPQEMSYKEMSLAYKIFRHRRLYNIFLLGTEREIEKMFKRLLE